MTFPQFAQGLAEAIANTGEAAPAVLFFAMLVEYVFPPFPGDLLVVLGAWYAVEGVISWPVAFASVTAGAIAGAWIDYRVGAALGRRLEGRAALRGSLSAERLARFEASYRRWGASLLVANRFFPGIRAFLFLAAGASGIPLRKVLTYGALSAALWNAVLLGAGALVAHNLEELVMIFERYTRLAWVAIAAAVAGGGLFLLLRRRSMEAAERKDGAP